MNLRQLAYWLAVATALQDIGSPSLVDSKGVTRDWRTEIARVLMKKQQFDGYWDEGTDRIAATTTAVAAMEVLYNAK